MKTNDLKELHSAYVMDTYSPGLALVRGQGARVWDAEGREYLDFIAGISVLNVGHSHPRVLCALQRQAERLVHVSNIYYNERQPQLARVISERSLGGKCFFCNSGAEANEAMIKLARLWGSPRGKYEIVTMQQSFHGRTLATLTATGQDKVKQGFEPLPAGFVHAAFNDLDDCRRHIGEKTVAVLLEPIQGEGGIRPATADFMRGVRELCDQHGILMLCDEIQSGMGRTGNWFAYQGYDVEPDVISMAKALGNGIPIGAICAKPEYSTVFQPGHHATTYGGNPLACAAAEAVFQVIEEENLLENVRQTGDYLETSLRHLATRHPSLLEIRGRGLMWGVVMQHPVKDLLPLLHEQGLLALGAGEQVLRFLPPLTITREDVDEAIEKLDRSLDSLQRVHNG